MSQVEVVDKLLDLIDIALNKSGGCKSMRFALVVWCDCCDQPKYIGGNDDDMGRRLKMLRIAGDVMLNDHELVEGHA